eukprot:10351065-Heterocapsa_arctica.AAC.1
MPGGQVAGGQMKGGPAAPGPPPLPQQQSAQSSGSAWFEPGQWIATEWNAGEATAWRQVQPGEQPWDNRVAACANANQNAWGGYHKGGKGK